MKHRVHVLFVVSSLCFGGAEKHVIALLNHLDIERFSLSLAYLKDEKTLLSQLDTGRLDGGAFCCHVSTKVDLRAVRLLSEHIREREIDVLVCTNAYSLLYGWLGRRRGSRRPKLVVVFHTTKPGTFKDWLQMLFYWPIFRAADLLVYVSENQRAYWRRKGLRAARDVVIQNGIDVKRFAVDVSDDDTASSRQSFGFSANDYLIGLCAAMRPEKAHEDLLTALARLRASGVRAKGLLIGDGPERKRIERNIADLGLSEHVKITGFMEDVLPTVAACDVMVLVSHHVETFSIAALEAMALGKPMVMTEIGGAREQVDEGKTGVLFSPGDVPALVSALKKLEPAETRLAMGQRARKKVVSQFSLEVMVPKYETALFDLVHGVTRARC